MFLRLPRLVLANDTEKNGLVADFFQKYSLLTEKIIIFASAINSNYKNHRGMICETYNLLAILDIIDNS